MSTPFYDLASLVVVPSGYKASKVYAQKPLTTDGQLTFSRASTATRVNASGLIEEVASGVPRLDYLGSTCPKILLEPQRSNLILQSEDFTTSWAANISPTITANATVAPDGTTTADSIASSGAGSGVFQVPTVVSGSAYSFSIYIKNISSASNIKIGCDLGPSNGFLNFNAVTGAIITTAAGITASSVTNAGNGWYRVSGTYITTGTVNTFVVFGESAMTFAAWGAMLEAGAYPTSYVKTTTAAVTRLADACYKTGISSLIGQTAGTMFIQVKNIKFGPLGGDFASIDDGTGGNRIQFFLNTSNKYGTYNEAGSATQWYFTSNVSPSGNDKIAIAYASNDAVLYINGQQVGSTNSFTAPSTSVFRIGDRFDNAVKPDIFECSQALLFKTRLTNAQLAELTAL